jgi:large repetitive protein
MVAAINFAVRDFAGGSQRGGVAGDGQGNFIQVGSGDSVSLNLSRASIIGYEQQGADLVVKLADGRNIVLSGYFNEAPGDVNHLYLSDNGAITEVILSESGDGLLFADYGPMQGWEKWSPLDDLRFADADGVIGSVGVSDEPAGMAALVPGLLGGAGGLGAAAAVVGGAAVIGGGGGGGTSGGGGDGGDGGTRRPPTVDDQNADPLTTNTDEPSISVTGTGEPGDSVEVTIGGVTETTVIGEDGTWSVTYPTDGLPGDGTHTTEVVVTQPDGTQHDLTGPAFVIDMTPPDVETSFGTTAQNDVENLEEYANGVSLGGTGEVGAEISVVINGHTQTTTVGANGNWAVTFTQNQIPGGDYHELPAVITATDPLGNQTVLNQAIAIDTVPHPIRVNSVAGDNLVNLAEKDGGFAVAGTSTPGATLTVTIGAVEKTVVVGDNGRWSVNFGARSVPNDGNAMVSVSTVDAAGNASSTTFPFRVDTTATLGVNMVAGDDVVNALENGGRITVTGTAEPGSTNVMVSWNGTTLPATVDPTTGNWQVKFPANLFGDIQSTQTAISVTATDSAGNGASATRNVRVDTLAEVDVSNGQIGGDDRMTASEASGFNLTGTSDPRASVTVTFEGQTVTVRADADGNWTAPFGFGSFGKVTRDGLVQVSATDAAGNTATTSHTIHIDTEVRNFRLTAVDDLSSLAPGADAVNAAEAANGVTISGTVEPGSTVTVHWGGMTLPASAVTVSANGVWTASVPASAIPAGQTSVTVTASARDQYGNLSSTLSQEVAIDRIVTPLTRSGGQLGGDGYINAAEAAAGVTLTGTVEPNSTVWVKLNGGPAIETTATANGTWTITVPSTSLPHGDDIPVTVQVSARDWVGNVRHLDAETVHVDTVAPSDPVRVGDAGAGNQLYGIATAMSSDDYSYHTVNAAGTATEITPAAEYNGTVDVNGQAVNAHWAMFGSAVADGTYLVINNEDAAGNQSSTLYLRNTTGEVVVDLSRAGLQSFDFGTIDLSAADANLTITEAQVLSLTGADKQLTIQGGADDVVNLVGATLATSGAPAGFKLYNLGSEASVLIDDDITHVNVTGV